MNLRNRLGRLEIMLDSKGQSELIGSDLASAYAKLGIDPQTMHAEAIKQGFSSPAEAVAARLGMTSKELKAELQGRAGQ